MIPFAHLHLHSGYSLLDGAVNLKDLFAALPAMGMKSVALTDHGVMYGIIPFYQQAMRAGIHPVIGCEVYMARNSHKDKRPRLDENPYHLVLLAEDTQGYQNLMELVSIAHLEGFYYKPRIDKDLLYKYRKGIIGLSACLAGEIPTLLLNGDEAGARQALKEYKDIFGPDNFFLELQDHGLEEQKKVNKSLIGFGKEYGLGLVATNDVHYLKQEDADAHDALLCIQTGKTMSDQNRMRFANDNFYLRSAEEMQQLFKTTPEAISNTSAIAARCKVELSFDKFFLPDFSLPAGKTPEEELETLCWEGLNKISEVNPTIEERLAYELKIIQDMGFASYFLIVRDFIKFARQNNIAVGPGRGSAAGSLVAYVLGITAINPLDYGLIFERFLNPERVTMPDIDIDFCFERRDEVINYVAEKYGHDRVAQVITFGTMAARAAIRDVGRVLGMPYGDVDKVAKDIPAVLGISLQEALEQSPSLQEKYQNDPQVKRLIDLARKLEGAPRHASTHAAGILITPDRLTKYTPLQKTKEDITTQYDMDCLEDIGLLKFDFLGLRTLTVIDQACQLIADKTGQKFNINEIRLDDKETYKTLQSGKNHGIFQMESELYKRLTTEYKPETFEDIIAIIALGRPGPMGSDRLGDFIECRHGKKEVEYIHPLLEPILKETYGVILYQEQVMEIASVLGGFSMGEADILRRGMGKKIGDLILQYKEKFIQEAQNRGVGLQQAAAIYNLMEFFGGYGFNKSHSAAYALICYQTGYLKTHYPMEFMAATLNSVKGNVEKVAQYIDECQEMGINVLPPCVNESGLNFTLAGNSIRFGLAAIKNVGIGAIDSVIEARQEQGPFISLLDFCQRVNLRKLNIRTLESLIKAGAFDSLGLNRAQLMNMVEYTYAQAQSSQKAKVQGQMSFLDLLDDSEKYRQDIKIPQVEEFSQRELLKMENEVLGFYISGHPLDQYKEYLRSKTTGDTSLFDDIADKKNVCLGGLISKVTLHQTRNGQLMAFLTLDDWYGSVELIVFPTTYEKYREAIVEGQAVIVKGKADRQDEEQKSKLIVSEFSPLQEPVLIRLPLGKIDGDFLQTLKVELKRWPQEVPTLLTFYEEENKITLSLGKSFWGPQRSEDRLQLQKIVEDKLKIH